VISDKKCSAVVAINRFQEILQDQMESFKLSLDPPLLPPW